MRRTFVLVALALLVTACQQQALDEQTPPEAIMPSKLTTSDGKQIAYTYYAAGKGKPGAILLHQLRRDRHDYDAFAPQLQDAGFNVISIDVRGHGESTGNWELFSADDFRKITLDIATAKEFLARNGADSERVVLIGASFTANAVINHAAQDKDVIAVIALSPGLDFRGIKPQEGIAQVPDATLLVAAEDDDYSAASVRTLAKANPAVETKWYPSGGHGFTLFSQTTLAHDILAWLNDRV